jgi:RNA polymerase sigma factor (sigma-70 family)
MQNAIATQAAPSGNALIKSHEKLIRALALRFVSSGAALDDLIQEANIALWSASKRWQADGGASVWTYGRKFVLAALMKCASAHLEQAHEDFGDEFAGKEDLEIALFVRECLNELAEEERVVVHLFMQGESFRTIGAQLGRSKSDVARTFEAAITTLRERAS